ncbi:hypothetical protein QYB53_003238 [Clostridium perfringens]|nr:hypothetical protein [Clostridium perfringens]
MKNKIISTTAGTLKLINIPNNYKIHRLNLLACQVFKYYKNIPDVQIIERNNPIELILDFNDLTQMRTNLEEYKSNISKINRL